MEVWQTILLAFGGNAALIAVLVFLGKSVVEKMIARDTTRFEHELRIKADAEVEQLKSTLRIKADAESELLKSRLQQQTSEHQVRFARLHEKRASVIAELYGYLIEMLWEAESFLSPIEWAGEASKKEKHKVASDAIVTFYRFLDKHRIYLPESLCDSLESLTREVRKHVINFGVYVRFDEATMLDHTRQQREKVWNDGWTAIKEEIPKARTALEHEFRALLGPT